MAIGQEARRLWNDAKRHPVLVIVGAVVLGFVVYYFYNRNKQQTANNNANQNSPGGYTILNEYYTASPQGQSDGSNPLTGVTGSQGSQGQSNPGNNTSNNQTNNVVGNTGKTSTPAVKTPSNGALIAPGKWPKNVPVRFGQTFTVNGTVYTIGPGGQGRIWGVPGTGYSLATWNQIPTQQQGGSKVLLYRA